MSDIHIREATELDVNQLYSIEQNAFANDRLSLRRLKYWIKAKNRVFLVAESQGEVAGYGLVLLHQGTRLARLYSIAINPTHQGKGLAKRLLKAVEDAASHMGRLYMRLEVDVENTAAVKLYEANGYTIFGSLEDYYENHHDALRMQKRIRHIEENLIQNPTPWFQQTTEFTCGPAALLMAMASLEKSTQMSQELELDIWREATTIFMTSGHGGCHPVGLALAATQRGFRADVFVNLKGPLFIEGVRNPKKKVIMEVVDKQFREKAKKTGIKIKHKDVTQTDITAWINKGYSILILISTYRIDGKKSPHWVTLTGMDDDCLYVHDPYPEVGKQNAFDCQYMPIARNEFAKMSAFGKEKLRTCVVIRKAQ